MRESKQLGEVAGGVGAGTVQLDQVLLLRLVEPGLAAAELAGCLRGRHALTDTSPDQVDLEPVSSVKPSTCVLSTASSQPTR
ncbi:hypothetical protein [Curtobacterium sp. SL109]|uniref:hypothetical protein n=1 Tax=Curtobacterium sp. SL109 TaxID=2994662 RepID=UPI002DD4456A|nr:hypothetical protein [Curtobacterium sp. SL109]